MLSRVADSLYWMSRYLERAEATLRRFAEAKGVKAGVLINGSRTMLAGQAVGVKEVDNGIWLVSFMVYDLGYIDLEERTLQPLDNPFGPKVLPMS